MFVHSQIKALLLRHEVFVIENGRYSCVRTHGTNSSLVQNKYFQHF